MRISQLIRGLSRSRYRNLVVFLLLALTVWAARFWHSPSFGLYEDDYTRIPQTLSMTGMDLVDEIIQAFKLFKDHGKPLHSSVIYTLAFLGVRLGGLRGVYFISFLVVTLNASLFYSLLNRQYGKLIAFLAGIAYCLYSADTTQAFLTHALGLQPSLTFFLLAAHAYLSNRKLLVYLLALCVLLTYETPFPLFLALPLFEQKWDRRLWKRLLVNLITLGVILLGLIVIRRLVGESRVTELGIREALVTPMQHMLIGPLVSLSTFFYRPIQVLKAIDLEIALGIGLGFMVMLFVLIWRHKAVSEIFSGSLTAIRSEGIFASVLACRRDIKSPPVPDELKHILKIGITGITLLVLAYPLTFTVRAHAISGRDTRVHFAGVVGAAMIMGCVSTLILIVSAAYRLKAVGNVILAGFFSLLLAYGFMIQDDYRAAWRLQQDFWTEAVRLIPDVGDGSIIIVEPEVFEDTLQIGANVWNLPRVLELLFHFPTSWDEPPRVYRLNTGWQNLIVVEGDLLKLDRDTTIAPSSLYTKVNSPEVIFLQVRSGQLTRRDEPLDIDEMAYPIKQSASLGEPPFERDVLFEWMIREEAD
jgi:hypothetical protein